MISIDTKLRRPGGSGPGRQVVCEYRWASVGTVPLPWHTQAATSEMHKSMCLLPLNLFLSMWHSWVLSPPHISG